MGKVPRNEADEEYTQKSGTLFADELPCGVVRLPVQLDPVADFAIPQPRCARQLLLHKGAKYLAITQKPSPCYGEGAEERGG